MLTLQWTRLFLLPGLVGFFLLIVSCGQEEANFDSTPIVDEITVPGVVKQAAWVGETIVFEYWPEPMGHWDAHLWAHNTSTKSSSMIPFATAESCGAPPADATTSPLRLPSGQLGYVEKCSYPASGLYASRYVFIATSDGDDKSPRVSVVLPYIPEVQLEGYLISPDRSKIVLGSGVAPESFITIDLKTGVVGDGLVPPFDQVWAKASSPDGSRIVYAGRNGEPTPWDLVASNLYLADWGFQKPTVLAKGIKALQGASWSPDGRSVAFTGSRDGTYGDYGIWIVDVESKKVTSISKGFFSTTASAWSPDGKKLVAVEHIPAKKGELRGEKRLVVVTVKP